MGIYYINCGNCKRAFPDCAISATCVKCWSNYCSEDCKDEAFCSIVCSRIESELKSDEVESDLEEYLEDFIESNETIQTSIKKRKRNGNDVSGTEILIKKFDSVFEEIFDNIDSELLYPCIRCVKDLKYRKFDDDEILEFALKKYKTTRKELIEQMKKQPI